MGRRTKAGTGDTDAFGDDRLAIYESTRVPTGRATGLPAARDVRPKPEEAPEVAPPRAPWNVVDLRDWHATPATESAPAAPEPFERFQPLVFELVPADSALPAMFDPDAAPFEPFVFTDDGLLPPDMPAAPIADAVEAADDADRRGAPRYVLRVPAAATFECGTTTELGDTGDVSAVGLLLHMPFEPPDTQLELIVGDEAHCALIRATVIDHRADAAGGFCWHLAVVSSDDAWTALVDRAADAAQPRSA